MKHHVPAALALSLLLGSCGGGGGSSSSAATGSLKLLATDKPFDHALVDVARVTVAEIRAHVEADGESGFLMLYDGDPFEVDLATLRNGITQLLTSGELPTGTYAQFRLRLTDGYLRLVNGNEYSTDAGNLKLTSQQQSGYKVMLDPPVEILADREETVVLDFDMTKTFKPTPASDPLNAQDYKLHPNIRAAVMSRSGNITGTISGDSQLLDDAVLYVLPAGEDDPDQSIATTATDATGSAVVLGLAPGVYDLLATHGTRQETLSGVVVTAGKDTGFELSLD